MTIHKRASILSALLALALLFYFAARYYSPDLIRHVVEQSFIQKAPPDVDPSEARRRFESILGADADKKARLQSLLKISEYLEKIQSITPEEWNNPDESFSGKP